jgi:hypothetical protein
VEYLKSIEVQKIENQDELNKFIELNLNLNKRLDKKLQSSNEMNVKMFKKCSELSSQYAELKEKYDRVTGEKHKLVDRLSSQASKNVHKNSQVQEQKCKEAEV